MRENIFTAPEMRMEPLSIHVKDVTFLHREEKSLNYCLNSRKTGNSQPKLRKSALKKGISKFHSVYKMLYYKLATGMCVHIENI